MQRDHLLEFMTVEETIYSYSCLKMKHATTQERMKRVDDLIMLLSLDSCRSVLVGGEKKKGISGGQMKRVAIAIELIDDPSMLFLDEPTSGLDSSLAYDTLKMLWSLAQAGRTVICTIHQPRSQVFQLFDQILLLSKGKVVYHGPAKEAVAYFEGLGYACPVQFNPADFLLDLVSAESTAAGASGADVEKGELNTKGTRQAFSVREGRIYVDPEEIDALPDKFAVSKRAEDIRSSITEIINSEHATSVESKIASYIASKEGGRFEWFRSIKYLCWRAFLCSIRDPMTAVANVIVNAFLGLVLGGIFFQLQDGSDTLIGSLTDARNIVGCLFFLVANLSFSTFQTLTSFPSKRTMFNRDSANGVYTSSAFFLGQIIADFPFQQIPPLFYLVIYYWMVGLAPTVGQFFTTLLVGSCIVFSANSFAYVVSCGVPNIEIANIIAPVTLVLFMLMSGFYLTDDRIPSWISWLKYLSFMRFGFFALVAAQFPSDGFFGVPSTDGSIQNSKLLVDLGLQSANLWADTAVVVALGLGYRIIAFLLLKFTNRHVGLEG